MESVTIEHIKLNKLNSLMGIDGNPINVPQIEMSLCFGNNTTTTIFSVLDATTTIAQIQSESGIQIHGILGIPFLIQNEWILDFKKLTISK